MTWRATSARTHQQHARARGGHGEAPVPLRPVQVQSADHLAFIVRVDRVALVEGRKLKLKAKFESGSSHLSFKR